MREFAASVTTRAQPPSLTSDAGGRRFSPELREVAILAVMLASAFNGLLLGILVITLTYKGGAIQLPKAAMEQDIEIMRIAIALCGIVFGTGVILNIFSVNQGAVLPIEVPIFLLLAYVSYLYFIYRKPSVSEHKAAEDGYPHGEEPHERGWLAPVLLGLVGIVIAAELISASSEYLVHMLDEDPAGETVRFVFGLRGLEPQPSVVLPGDTTFEHEGRLVVVLDKTMCQMLEDKTLDVEDTKDGPILRLL